MPSDVVSAGLSFSFPVSMPDCLQVRNLLMRLVAVQALPFTTTDFWSFACSLVCQILV